MLSGAQLLIFAVAYAVWGRYEVKSFKTRSEKTTLNVNIERKRRDGDIVVGKT
jgi:hypothetical protein